jgi:hypothetical protein
MCSERFNLLVKVNASLDVPGQETVTCPCGCRGGVVANLRRIQHLPDKRLDRAVNIAGECLGGRAEGGKGRKMRHQFPADHFVQMLGCRAGRRNSGTGHEQSL